MNKTQTILLPGLHKQIRFVENRIELADLNILVIGSGSAAIANYLSKQNSVEYILEDFESLISTKLELDNSTKINVKLMDFERTDFSSNQFDLVYAQGSVSDIKRNKIIKEIKRITKPSGYICLGEIVKLKETTPVFVKELFDSSNLDPLYNMELAKYYQERNFEIIDSIDLSATLSDYYRRYERLLDQKVKSLTTGEKSYYKKVLNKIKHESKAYLKLGADQYIGFVALLLKKG